MILIPIITIGVFLMFREERKLTKKVKDILFVERMNRMPNIKKYTKQEKTENYERTGLKQDSRFNYCN